MNYSLYKSLLPALFVASFFLVGCEELIEPDLEDETVTIVSPPDKYESSSLTVTFEWDEEDGADNYNLQIWNEDGIRVLNATTDTIVYDYTFPYFGTFTWKVRAQNGTSNTAFTSYTIIIDSTDNISTMELLLTSPDDNYYTNEFDISFEWDALYSAEDYRFEITDLDGDLIDNAILTTDNSLDYTFDEEGDYIWKVRAQNSSSNTPYSTRYITIDTTAPTKPTLSYPLITDTVTSFPFTMIWSRGTESGSPITDSIYVSEDSLFTLSKIILNDIASSTSYSFTDTISDGIYYWYVRSIDAAGNESLNSTVTRFVVDQ